MSQKKSKNYKNMASNESVYIYVNKNARIPWVSSFYCFSNIFSKWNIWNIISHIFNELHAHNPPPPLMTKLCLSGNWSELELKSGMPMKMFKITISLVLMKIETYGFCHSKQIVCFIKNRWKVLSGSFWWSL